jgi:hypothetical protein
MLNERNLLAILDLNKDVFQVPFGENRESGENPERAHRCNGESRQKCHFA